MSGGVLAVSELTWLTRERPAELDAQWQHDLAEDRWLDNYYRPKQDRFTAFLAAYLVLIIDAGS